ncbi:MAG: c-type cytochrome [Gemmobacter sp.]|nr:c-type cytochrome [Gemmobacter sp.]
MRRAITGVAMLAIVVVAGCTPEGGPGASSFPGGSGSMSARISGKALYGDFCAACHGDSGKGDGPAAAGLSPKPADLTTLAQRNKGVFPIVSVMGKVYGYSHGKGGGGGPMPEFGPLLEGSTVLVETAPGIMTPTPEKLVALAEYVASLGAKAAP